MAKGEEKESEKREGARGKCKHTKERKSKGWMGEREKEGRRKPQLGCVLILKGNTIITFIAPQPQHATGISQTRVS